MNLQRCSTSKNSINRTPRTLGRRWLLVFLLLSRVAIAAPAMAQVVPQPQRVIPLRIIQPYACDVLANPSPRCSSIKSFQATVQRGTKTFEAAGIRFWIKSIEYYDLPLTRLHDTVNDYSWAQVRGELSQVFPNILLNAYTPSETKRGHHWMIAATIFWGDPTEVVVILHEEKPNYSYGQGPWGGKVVYLRYNHVGGSDPLTASTFLPHELGHFHGLTHLDGGPGNVFYNPQTGQPYSNCDF